MPKRPPFIVSSADVPETRHRYPNSGEDMAPKRAIGRAAGLLQVDEWVAHVRQHSFAWLQRFSRGGRAARAALAGEIDRALRTANASGLKWFDEGDRNLRTPAESPQ